MVACCWFRIILCLFKPNDSVVSHTPGFLSMYILRYMEKAAEQWTKLLLLLALLLFKQIAIQ